MQTKFSLYRLAQAHRLKHYSPIGIITKTKTNTDSCRGLNTPRPVTIWLIPFSSQVESTLVGTLFRGMQGTLPKHIKNCGAPERKLRRTREKNCGAPETRLWRAAVLRAGRRNFHSGAAENICVNSGVSARARARLKESVTMVQEEREYGSKRERTRLTESVTMA